MTRSSFNTAVGTYALRDNEVGLCNTAVGVQAGYQTNIAGSNNTYLGYNTGANANYLSNSTAIGAGATITASNQIVLGTATEKVVIPNQIQYSYTSVPTLTSTSLGYYIQTSIPSGPISNPLTLGNYSNIPVGIYMWSCSFTNFDVNTSTRNDVEINSSSNITRLSGNTLEYCGTVGGKIGVNAIWWLMVTSTTNSLAIRYNNVVSPVGQITAHTTILVRIA